MPPLLVAGLGGSATFTCSHHSSVNIEWLVNGTSLTSLQLDVVQGFIPVGSVQVGSLEFRNVQVEYNNTRTQCIVNTTSHELIQSQNSMLLVQGLLKLQQYFDSMA